MCNKQISLYVFHPWFRNLFFLRVLLQEAKQGNTKGGRKTPPTGGHYEKMVENLVYKKTRNVIFKSLAFHKFESSSQCAVCKDWQKYQAININTTYDCHGISINQLKKRSAGIATLVIKRLIPIAPKQLKGRHIDHNQTAGLRYPNKLP